MSIQDRILESLLADGFTKDELAKAAGLEGRRMIDYTLQKDGGKQISRKALARLADNLGMTVEELYSRGTQHEAAPHPNLEDFRYLPLRSAHPLCGFGGEETSAEISNWLAFRYEWLVSKGNPETMSCFHVLGDSMSGTLENGDLILVDESQKRVMTGLIYLVLVNGQLMVKRASVRPDSIQFLSDNPRYEPIVISNNDDSSEVVVHGRIVWAAHEF